MLPPDWRERMTEWVRGAEEPDASWFRGGPVLSPRAQIEVYREQYRLRLGDALREEIPGLIALIGDDEAVDALIVAYLAARPSQSFTLNRVADALAEWMEAAGHAAVHVDMARLDRAVMAGFEAAEGRTPRPEDLAVLPPLRLQPHVRLLRLGHTVHAFRSAVLAEQEPEPVEARDVPLVTFRVERRMRHLELDPWAWALLAALDAGLTVPEALDEVLLQGCLPAHLERALSGWFRLFVERGLVERAPA